MAKNNLKILKMVGSGRRKYISKYVSLNLTEKTPVGVIIKVYIRCLTLHWTLCETLCVPSHLICTIILQGRYYFFSTLQMGGNVLENPSNLLISHSY